MRALRLLLPILLLAACGADDEGAVAFDEGRFEDAHAAFAALDAYGDLNRDFHETLYRASELKYFKEIAANRPLRIVE